MSRPRGVILHEALLGVMSVVARQVVEQSRTGGQIRTGSGRGARSRLVLGSVKLRLSSGKVGSRWDRRERHRAPAYPAVRRRRASPLDLFGSADVGRCGRIDPSGQHSVCAELVASPGRAFRKDRAASGGPPRVRESRNGCHQLTSPRRIRGAGPLSSEKFCTSIRPQGASSWNYLVKGATAVADVLDRSRSASTERRTRIFLKQLIVDDMPRIGRPLGRAGGHMRTNRRPSFARALEVGRQSSWPRPRYQAELVDRGMSASQPTRPRSGKCAFLLSLIASRHPP